MKPEEIVPGQKLEVVVTHTKNNPEAFYVTVKMMEPGTKLPFLPVATFRFSREAKG